MRYSLLALLLIGCSTTQEAIEARQNKMLACVDHFTERNTTTKDSYEMCRRIYGSTKLQRTSLPDREEE